ncbi:MAG TPA: pyridoxal-phosphate dependent enzyme [Blastocatellia bacterium]|jgi:1-aminocyclopropane-1-carboxylate deaminase/D-cysteine desulfhydrase-like pyridoxal-dependent ACC family enzyme|nr:pyridoxal-phosphate dependent enzyme [Blastocatellia bacterium]
MDSLFCDHTPVEEYRVGHKTIFVKRDDLFGRWPAPPLSKLRGLRLLLETEYAGGTRLVGCWDTRISKLGQGLAACCAEFPGMKCIVSYPTKKGERRPASVDQASELGAEIYPVPGSRISISYSRARKYVEGRGGLMLPFGLECPEAVEGIKQEASRTPAQLIRGGTLVLCCGSGVTLAGLLSGLPVLPQRVVGISSGRSLRNIAACVRRYVEAIPECLELHEPTMPYSVALSYDCPFPTHPNYDLKAWKFLVENLRRYKEPILFWNIGA